MSTGDAGVDTRHTKIRQTCVPPVLLPIFDRSLLKPNLPPSQRSCSSVLPHCAPRLLCSAREADAPAVWRRQAAAGCHDDVWHCPAPGVLQIVIAKMPLASAVQVVASKFQLRLHAAWFIYPMSEQCWHVCAVRVLRPPMFKGGPFKIQFIFVVMFSRRCMLIASAGTAVWQDNAPTVYKGGPFKVHNQPRGAEFPGIETLGKQEGETTSGGCNRRRQSCNKHAVGTQVSNYWSSAKRGLQGATAADIPL